MLSLYLTNDVREEKTQKIFIFFLFFENSILNWNVSVKESMRKVEEGTLSQKSKRIIIYSFILLIVGTNTIFACGADSTPVTDPIVILFDEAHDQFFNRSLYSQALSVLDDFTDNEVKIIYNTAEFNSTTFQGVDIFICTNPGSSFSAIETASLAEFLVEGNSMFLLSNPLNEVNNTLMGRGDYLNELLLDYRLEIVDKFWTHIENIGDIRNPSVIINEFDNAGIPTYLKLDVSNSTHEIFSIDQNVSSLVTYTSSLVNTRVNLVIAPSDAIVITVANEIYNYPSDVPIISTTGEMAVGARIVMSGSSIMFSDLSDALLGTTWYESADNSNFWLNCITWLAEINPDVLPPNISLNQVLLLVITITGIAGLLILIGGGFFFIGSGKEVSIAKIEQPKIDRKKKKPPAGEKPDDSKIIKEDKPDTKQKESKRDRRIKQIQKHSRGKKR